MRRALLVLSLVLTACFNPDDILPVHGTLTSADPVEGQVVRLLRDPSGAREASCNEAKPFKETTADEAGHFSFDVFRAQAIKLTGQGVFCFRVETTFPSGSTVFSDIVGLNGEVTLLPFPDWRAAPSRVDGVLRFEPFAPIPMEESFEGDQLVHRAQWLTADGGVAWVVDDRVMVFNPMTNETTPTRQPMDFDDYALEDFSGAVTLSARFTVTEASEGPFGSNSTTLEARSGQTLQVSGNRTPFSRGLECPPLGTPCFLTDGDLSPADGGGQAVSFSLPAPSSVSAVVVRGTETDVSLMGLQLFAADGGMPRLVSQLVPTSLWNAGVPSFTLRPLPDGGLEFGPRADPRFLSIRLDGGVLLKEVRIVFANGVQQVGEISLFE